MEEEPRRDDPAYYEALGRAIQVARTELGLSRRDLAERAGVSYTYLADIENGRRRPSSLPLIKISHALGISPSKLLARAELYHSRGTGRPFLETAAQGYVGEDLEHRAALAFGPPADLLSSLPAEPGPGEPEPRPRRAWRDIQDRGAAPEPEQRARRELRELIEELSPSDLRIVLELVRRMIRR
jgi:transcriptional regulator with XRE-family HTH domain